jgi:hypothetical protein
MKKTHSLNAMQGASGNKRSQSAMTITNSKRHQQSTAKHNQRQQQTTSNNQQQLTTAKHNKQQQTTSDGDSEQQTTTISAAITR